METTEYFDNTVPVDHPEAVDYRSYVEKALTDSITTAADVDNRTRHWI